jgi:hypothetical protein
MKTAYWQFGSGYFQILATYALNDLLTYFLEFRVAGLYFLEVSIRLALFPVLSGFPRSGTFCLKVVLF